MIHFKLKRKISGKKLRQLRRAASKSQEIVTPNEVWGHTFSYKPLPYRSSVYWHNESSGKRKYPTAIYELEGSKKWDDIERRHIPAYDWKVFRLVKDLERNKKKNSGKLQRLYKLYPEFSPAFEREKEHNKKVAIWKEKLHKNHLMQCYVNLQNKY